MKLIGIIGTFVLISFFTSLTAQTLSRQIKWKNNKICNDSLTSWSLFNFEGAEHIGFKYAFPYFYETINLKKYPKGEYSVKLENPLFKVFSETELKNVKRTDEIPENLNFESHFLYNRKVPYLTVKILPLRRNKNTGKIEKLISFDLKIEKKSTKIRNKKRIYAEKSVLANGTFFKIKIRESAVYKITYEELQNIGIENPENVRIFGNPKGMLSFLVTNNSPDDLQECDIVKNENSVIFYAKGIDRWDYNAEQEKFKPVDHLYSDYSYYFITSDYNSGTANTVQTINSNTQNETNNVNFYNSYSRHNLDAYNIVKSGRTFYGELFDVQLSQSFSFNFPNLLNNSTANIEVRVAGASSLASSFTVECSGVSNSLEIGANGEYIPARTDEIDFDITTGTSKNIIVNITYNRGSNPSWKGWLDYIVINTKSELRFTDSLISFRNLETVGLNNISKFNLSNAGSSVKIWDITNPVEPKQINTNIAGSLQTFKLETTELREFVAFDENKCKNIVAEDIIRIDNQNLHGISENTDMIIVCHNDFYQQAVELKEIHENRDNMNIVIVNPEQIYNEFSAGAPDVSAIRNFAKCIYEKGTTEKSLKYLLLFGDGSFMNKGEPEEYDNYILTYQSINSYSEAGSYTSDDFFGYLDDGEGEYNDSLHGLLDIGIGRIPVNTSKQASDYINKIKTYLKPENFGDWQNDLCFVADDENGVVHMHDTDVLTRYISKHYKHFNIEKIYFDAHKQLTVSGGERYPDVNKAITNRVQKGALLINYTGHGGDKGWADERVLTINEIESWTNKNKLPMFVTATCEFTPFDKYNFLSAGERIFNNPNGGAIAMFTTARLAYIVSNAELTKRFYETVFANDENGKRYRLGDISRITKNQLTNKINNKIFFLLGDPALELAYAKYNVVTNTINGQSTTIDTIKALEKVTFTGEIQDNQNNKMTGFNGIIYPTVFDKKQDISTLNNDGGGVFQYKTRNNIIYRGKASVKNGEFSFSFIVPKDIRLNVDTGKVSYYAENGIIDAKGASIDFLVGDFENDHEIDNEGPIIKLFMNDNNFVSGGITDKNPKIYAELWDKNGINTSTGGIGHEITAILNSDAKSVMLLNNDYRADMDSYQSGTVEHFLFDLETGNHNLKFKAWDVYNNSSEEYIEFVVLEAENLSIERLLNYPNPFTTHTDFYFEHNQAGTNLDVLIQIFTVSGKLVKTIEDSFTANGYRAGPFAWNGTDDFGNRIGRGVYIYKVKVRSEQSELVEKFEKLLILK